MSETGERLESDVAEQIGADPWWTGESEPAALISPTAARPPPRRAGKQRPQVDPQDPPEPTGVRPADPPPEMSAPSPRLAGRRLSPRLRALGLLAIAIIVVVAATFFSNAQSVEDIAIEGTIGVRTEAALSAAAVSQNRVAQTILLARAVELELAPAEELAASVSSAEAGIDELERRIGRAVTDLGAESSIIEGGAETMIGALERALAESVGGDLSAADAALREADTAFAALAVDLAGVRDAALNDIVVARETAGQVAVGARLLVAFLIPMVTVLGYRFIIVRAARRRELQRELEAERSMLRAKDELIANISHELRTPLTGILGFSQEAALEDSLTPDDLRMMAGVVAGEADELSRMVDDLITTARDQEDALGMAIEAVDPNQEMNAVQIPAVIAGREIDVDLPSDTVLVDRLRLRQILRNLVSNALKYGGPNVAVEGVVKGGTYYLSVVDDGDGVPAELEERLFTRFVHQGDAPLMTGSVGLGLSIARRLAEIMGGSLSYSRSDDKTYFTVALPLAPDRSAASSQVA